MKRAVYASLVLITCSWIEAAPTLQKENVKGTLDEMFAYHVEYREFSPLIAKRSLKIYLEQFDPMKMYLTQEEVRPYLDPSSGEIAGFIERYQREDFSDYEKLNELIGFSILRAREYRMEAERELIANPREPRMQPETPYTSYAANQQDLKERITLQMAQILSYEQKNGDVRGASPAQRKKIFNFWERRFARNENTYLPHGALTQHYLYLHILKSVSKSLDAHTTYFSPEEAYDMRTSLEKQFEGIGVVLREGIDGVVIHNMIKGGPAERSGQIQVGDILVEIDGYNVEGSSYEEVLKRLQGKGNNQVQIGLRHYESDEVFKSYRIDLKREKIVMQDDRVTYTYEPCEGGVVAKIVLPSFYESGGAGLSCEQDLKEALRAIRKHGEIKGVVVDMRENSGGFLTQAVKVSGLFMSSGVVVISKYAYGMTQYLRELDGKSFYSGPLVVLTSRASASAAEIVAQALQDYGLAVIVGDDRTYGKGTIQYQTVTDPRAVHFFKVTIGRYYTVSGRTTQIDGVKADVLAPTVYSVLPIGERYLEYSLKSDRIPSAYSDPLADVDPRNKNWFQKNYIPNLQKKLSLWTQMLPELKEQSAARIQGNRAYMRFLKAISEEKEIKLALKMQQDQEDFQMQEALHVLHDMMQAKGAAKIQ